MKRSVAINGPTPAFIRWAIARPCELRDIEVDNLADGTFRQLRTLRELSEGIEQRRVVDGFCLAADTVKAAEADAVEPSDVLAFPIEEVFDLFGDAESISNLCHQCPANCILPSTQLSEHQTRWAGCFGWLATDLNYSFDPAVEVGTLRQSCLIERVNRICETGESAEFFHSITVGRNLPSKAQPFYTFWQSNCVEPDMLPLLGKVFGEVARAVEQHSELNRFAVACQRASEHQMGLFVELVPRGYSDGIHWRRNAACVRCGFDVPENEKRDNPCPGCGTDAPLGHFRKSKVLGRRPFLHLEKIISADGTRDLINRYRKRTR
jgi:hypothetical protein